MEKEAKGGASAPELRGKGRYRTAKVEEGYLPGMAPKRIPDVHQAAVRLVDCDARLTRVQGERKNAALRLSRALKKAGINAYHVDGVQAFLKINEKVQAKREGPAPEARPKSRKA